MNKAEIRQRSFKEGAALAHRYTPHGHPCCELANDPPVLVLTCGFNGNSCQECTNYVAAIHRIADRFAAPSKPLPDEYPDWTMPS